MNKVDHKIIERIQQLEEKANKVKSTHKPNPPRVIGFPTLDTNIFNEWKVSVENLIIKVSGKDSPYYENFKNVVKHGYQSDVDSGVGILRGLKDDIEQGFLASVQELVKAEVFTDFLEISQHLLENNYKDPAASLIGAILENGLKDIAAKYSISFSKKDGIDNINNKLAKSGIYNALVQKQVDVWRTIRNSADHGKFDEYTLEDVNNMKLGVESFLVNNL
ncbi:MAG: hypothetical protein H7843_13725 [Nitrospirota bacterium]